MKHLLKYRGFWAIVMLIAAFTSCSKDDALVNDPASKEDFILTVQVGNQQSLRVATEDESAIHNLWVFIFESSADDAALIYGKECHLLNKSGSSSTFHASVEPGDAQTLQSKAGKHYLVVVANHSFGTINHTMTLSQLNHSVSQQVLNGNPLFDKLPMVAEKEIMLNYPYDKKLDGVELERMVSKISVLKPTIDIKNYESVGEPQISIENYADKGYLNVNEMMQGVEMKKLLGYREYKSGQSDPINFYSYETDWSNDEAYHTVVLYKVMLRKKGEEGAKPYYYLSKIKTAVSGSDASKLLRNVVYEVSTTINRVGSFDESKPLELVGNEVFVNPLKWNKGMSVIDGVKYLYVREHVIYMTTDKFEVPYESSSDLEKPEIEECYYGEMGASGGKTGKDADQNERPKISVDKEHKKIVINSFKPTNYKVRYAIIKLTNRDGNVDHIWMRRYPPVYITWQQGYVYKVRTIYRENNNTSLNDNSSVAYPDTMSVYFYNKAVIENENDREGPYRIVIPQEPYQNTVSPDLEIAPIANSTWSPGRAPYLFATYSKPHKGGYNQDSEMWFPMDQYEKEAFPGLELNRNWFKFSNADRVGPKNAVFYCTHLTQNGGGWRLPTREEVQFIFKVFNDPNSPAHNDDIKNLPIWSADGVRFFNPNYKKGDDDGKPKVDSRKAAVARCVRDVFNEKDEW